MALTQHERAQRARVRASARHQLPPTTNGRRSDDLGCAVCRLQPRSRSRSGATLSIESARIT
jgi:hypothetical protein